MELTRKMERKRWEVVGDQPAKGKEEAAGEPLAVAEGNGSRRSLQGRRRSAAGGGKGNGTLGFRLGGLAKKEKRGGSPL